MAWDKVTPQPCHQGILMKMPGAVSIGLGVGAPTGSRTLALRCPGGAEDSEAGLVLSCMTLHPQLPPAPSPHCACVLPLGCSWTAVPQEQAEPGRSSGSHWKASVTLASVLALSPWQPAEFGPSFIGDSITRPHMLNRTCW